MSWKVPVRTETARMVLPDGRRVERRVEVRTHPLTGDTVRVLTPPFRPLRIPDIRERYAHTREGCPFCPGAVESITPRFDPDECDRPLVSRGQAKVFPNLLAYSGVCALTVVTEDHFVGITEWEPAVILDALLVARRFFRTVQTTRPDMATRLIHWNYMPPSGSSMIHPHHQLMATATPPTRLARLAEGSRRMAGAGGPHPWEEIVDAERELGERWVGVLGRWSWMCDPAPQGRFFELVGVHERCWDLLDLEDEDLSALAQGLCRVMSYLESQGLWSFNLALMGLPRAGGFFRCQARIVPRAFFPPAECSDIHFDVIEHEAMVLRSPEHAAREARAFFPDEG